MSNYDVANDLFNILNYWQKNEFIYIDYIIKGQSYLKTKPNNRFLLDEKSQQLQQELKRNTSQYIIPSLYPYNLTISDTKKMMWFRVAKVGSRTIYNHLKQNIYLDCEHAHNIYYSIDLYKDYFKFAFVRNPWDRLVSCWHNKIIKGNYFQLDANKRKKMQKFPNFVNYVANFNIETCDVHVRLQSRLIDLNEIDFIGRFETFAEDYATICQKLNIPLDNLTHRNKSSKTKHYTEFYTDELREKVHRIYLKDIQIFGYKFQE